MKKQQSKVKESAMIRQLSLLFLREDVELGVPVEQGLTQRHQQDTSLPPATAASTVTSSLVGQGSTQDLDQRLNS